VRHQIHPIIHLVPIPIENGDIPKEFDMQTFKPEKCLLKKNFSKQKAPSIEGAMKT